ncbi:allantoate amidohydrolase [Galbitalea soli]|uniref:Allantoate amidohydrolase n=1 Tax=Galbitalea soli TaxID=1268042 RepID=A0A7C9TQI6_9MICO|nr:allantoate amidohydrolase [Galbitalea soli]
MLAGLDEIRDLGADPVRGGYSRHLWSTAELGLREWFVERATRLGLGIDRDRNGNLWAWWGEPGADAVVTGSHLDSVPGGGAYDGPLGVVSALDAVARLKARGFTPHRPFAVIVFAEEEGSRFGVACLGSRLMVGSLDPAVAGALRDRDGVTLADAARYAGEDPELFGPDPAALGRIGLFIELHVEQGRGLVDLGSAVGVASGILAHGRWRLSFEGEGNHAGATPMIGRRDPMVAAAAAILAVREAALARPGTRATVGRLEAVPGGTNVIPSRVQLWLDARAETDAEAHELVATIAARASASAFVEESWSSSVEFDASLRDRFAAGLGGVPVLSTGAGHDAGVLAAHVPSAMLFVRNPSGVSHAPGEFAELADCVAGTDALESLLVSVL